MRSVDWVSFANFVGWRGVRVAQRARAIVQKRVALFQGVPRPRHVAAPSESASSMSIDLTGKIAVVTGATGELGRVIARTLARCGADVAVHYHRNAEGALALERELEAMGRRTVSVSADVGEPDSVMAMRDRVGEALGAPDIVVNNAVLQYGWTSVLAQSVDDFDGQYRTCVRHNVLMAKAFVPAMIAKGGGRIIGINSECAMQASPSQGAYVAAKRGMDGVLRVLAREVGPHGITVNQVAPGWMISDKHRLTGSERAPGYERGVPLRRRGFDTDVAMAVAFLASEHAAFITGVFLPVCGGNVMPAI